MFLCADDLNHKSGINISVFQDVIPSVAIFRRTLLPPSYASSVLKMEVADFSENLSSSVSVQNITYFQLSSSVAVQYMIPAVFPFCFIRSFLSFILLSLLLLLLR